MNLTTDAGEAKCDVFLLSLFLFNKLERSNFRKVDAGAGTGKVVWTFRK